MADPLSTLLEGLGEKYPNYVASYDNDHDSGTTINIKHLMDDSDFADDLIRFFIRLQRDGAMAVKMERHPTTPDSVIQTIRVYGIAVRLVWWSWDADMVINALLKRAHSKIHSVHLNPLFPRVMNQTL